MPVYLQQYLDLCTAVCFGNEEILSPIWMSPLHSKSNINTILYVSVGYGAFIIIITMIANMINCIKCASGETLFDKTGLPVCSSMAGLWLSYYLH